MLSKGNNYFIILHYIFYFYSHILKTKNKYIINPIISIKNLWYTIIHFKVWDGLYWSNNGLHFLYIPNDFASCIPKMTSLVNLVTLKFELGLFPMKTYSTQILINTSVFLSFQLTFKVFLLLLEVILWNITFLINEKT